jgi:hypothetical protein
VTNRKGAASGQNLKKRPFLVIILYLMQIQWTDEVGIFDKLMGKVTNCHFTHKFAAAWKTNLPQ